MPKFMEGSIVKLSKFPIGGIKGVVDSLVEQEGFQTQYYVEWDQGSFEWHPEKDLMFANIDNPAQQYKKWS